MAKRTYGKTASGKPITDDLVGKLAERAEAGYDVGATIRRRGGRPPMGSAAASVESVRLEPELREALAQRAERENESASAVIRKALRAYVGTSAGSMSFDNDAVVEELREVLAEAEELVPVDMPRFTSGTEPSQAISLMRSAIERFTPADSSYRRQVAKLTHHPIAAARADTAAELKGTLAALIRDFEKGRLRTIEELIHSDVSGDYLEQAATLLRAGYKDAAVVVAGSVLEQHLHQLASKHGVSVFAGGKWKKAERLNADLAKVGAYGKTEQKAITALLGRRNEAAHGHYDVYTSEDARLMLDQVAGLLARYPA